MARPVRMGGPPCRFAGAKRPRAMREDSGMPEHTPPIAHTNAGFKALLELVGLSQQALADELGVRAQTVRRWCISTDPDAWRPPDTAWALLEGLYDRQRQAVDAALDRLDLVRDSQGRDPDEIVLTYFRSQPEYDEHGRDSGSYACANSTSRAVADALVSEGVAVRFEYWDTGAVRTPGSRY